MPKEIESSITLPVAKVDRFLGHLTKTNEKLKANGAPLLEVQCSDPYVFQYPDGNLYPVIEVSINRSLDTPVGFVELLSMSKVNLVTEVMAHKTYRELTRLEREAMEHPAGACFCDHCETVRPRVYMYTLKTPDGIKRVGSGCLDKYTGLDYKRWIDAYHSTVNDAEKLREMDFSEASHHAVYPVHEFLCEAVEHLKTESYKPKSHGEFNTGHVVFEAVGVKYQEIKGGEFKYTHDVVAKANLIFSFLLEASSDPSRSNNDYHNNLKLIAEYGYLTQDQASMLASSVPAYEKHVAAQQFAKANDHVGNNHIGSKSDKVILQNLEVEYVKPREGRYGESTEIRFLDSQGNMLKWNASGVKPFKTGDVINLKGTVADHESWFSGKYGKMIACTNITRCSVLNDEEVLEASAVKERKPKRKARSKQTAELESPPF